MTTQNEQLENIEELKWREEFIGEFKLNPYYWDQHHLLILSENNPSEFKEQATQAKWLWYLSARRKAQEEINDLRNTNVEICGHIAIKQEEIQKLKAENERLNNTVQMKALQSKNDEIILLKALLVQARSWVEFNSKRANIDDKQFRQWLQKYEEVFRG